MPVHTPLAVFRLASISDQVAGLLVRMATSWRRITGARFRSVGVVLPSAPAPVAAESEKLALQTVEDRRQIEHVFQTLQPVIDSNPAQQKRRKTEF
jgi:hypothetical protein